MPAGVVDEFSGCIEAHRLGVEQAGQERGRVVELEPGRREGQVGEGKRMRFGEAEGRESLDFLR